MKRAIIFILLIFYYCNSFSQSFYADSINNFIKNYVETHEVVTGDDRKLLHFYPANEKYHVIARFEKVENGKWFSMETSGRTKQVYRVYGTLYFAINDTAVKLNLYQSQNLMTIEKYKNHLFLPFTDLTSGEETYDNGRYIDLETGDIKNKTVEIDFNKAYNPYCAYVSNTYNCPIPPKENYLPVAILAGEKNYGKSSH